jgi:hypothetical protein
MCPLEWVNRPEPEKVWNWRTQTMVWNYKVHKYKCSKCGFVTKTKTYNPDVYATITVDEALERGASVTTELRCKKCGNTLVE